MAEDDTRPYSLDDLKAMRDRDDYVPTRPDAPSAEIEPEFWDKTRVVMPRTGKASVHLRVDSDVLEWFKAQGEDHLTRMNAVLRSYVEAQKHDRAEPQPPARDNTGSGAR